MADKYVVCDVFFDSVTWVRCPGVIALKDISQIVTTDYIAVCSEAFIQNNGWVYCGTTTQSVAKDQVQSTQYLFNLDDLTYSQSGGYIRDNSSAPSTPITGQQFIDLLDPPTTEDTTALVEALTNNTESVQFTAGVMTAGILYGVFIYAILKNI